MRSMMSSLREHHAAERSDLSHCAALLSHRGTGTSAGDRDYASRFASSPSAEIRWTAFETDTSDSQVWMSPKAGGLRLQVRTQQRYKQGTSEQCDSGPEG